MKTQATALLSSFLVVALATTLVLPGRATTDSIRLFFDGLSNSVRATPGMND